jgi:hypothetical protein
MPKFKSIKNPEDLKMEAGTILYFTANGEKIEENHVYSENTLPSPIYYLQNEHPDSPIPQLFDLILKVKGQNNTIVPITSEAMLGGGWYKVAD